MHQKAFSLVIIIFTIETYLYFVNRGVTKKLLLQRSPLINPRGAKMKRRTLPVLLERDFRKMAATDGATVEIECVSAPDPAERFSGEWLFYVVSREGDRFMLVTATARERIINSPIGLFGMASGKLNLDHLDVPFVAGDVRGGMYSRPGGSDPLE